MSKIVSGLAVEFPHVLGTGSRLIARALLWLLALIILDRIIVFGVSPALLFLAVISGMYLASHRLARRLTNLGLIAVTGIAILVFWLFQKTMAGLVAPNAIGMFSIFNTVVHLRLLFICLSLAFVSTWYVLYSKHTLTLEFIILVFACLFLFEKHHQYRLDLVKFVNSLAWTLGLSPLLTLVLVSVLLIAFLFWYLGLSPLIPGKIFKSSLDGQVKPHQTQGILRQGTALSIILLILFFIGSLAFKYHSQVLSNRLQNGVGSESEEGVNPLDFHSSLGNSQEPTALVRLEGDYLENPHSPMLYFRESAVSKLDGNQLVNAGAKFDNDVTWSSPKQFYKSDGNANHNYRIPLTQSIYSLVNNNISFAIDYPISVVPLKLSGKNKKFKLAYRAYSMVPSYTEEQLVNSILGNPDWTQEQLEHYLQSHPDKRYQQKAENIVKDVKPGIGYAFAVVNYLSKNSIYTLTPYHDVQEDEDPVVPYLFGDMRGYCVHFAYATTYLLRSLGVPARVATGYLTDLSQAKDGHILLRMNDRHAWAEVYVRGIGWIPFDTQPDQVENHGEAPVDASVLEELMGLLEPGEELLPTEEAESEPGMEPDSSPIKLPEFMDLAKLLGIALLLLAAFKLYLITAWRLPASNARQLERGVTGTSALLNDLGYQRNTGETLQEFETRLNKLLGHSVFKTSALFNKLKYRHAKSTLAKDLIIKNIKEDRKQLIGLLTLTQKLRLLFNPSSIFQILGGKRW